MRCGCYTFGGVLRRAKSIRNRKNVRKRSVLTKRGLERIFSSCLLPARRCPAQPDLTHPIVTHASIFNHFYDAFLNNAPGFDILSSMLHRLLCISVVFAVSSFALPETVQILNKDGKAIEGLTALAGFTLYVNGSTRKIVLSDVLSVPNGEPASPSETARIQSGLA